MGLTVAVTGPTGQVGISAVTALERVPDIERIVGMARRPFDPASLGWTKTEYRQGDILDRAAVDALVEDADVVVHLAFLVLGARREGARVNLRGTRDVFEAAVAGAAAGRPARVVYTSSVAAYGYGRHAVTPIREDEPTRGSPEHYYSQQKADVEAAVAEVTRGSGLEVFVLRPCIVVGPQAAALADAMPWRRLPRMVRRAAGAVPVLKVPVPDPGFPVQLVHHDDLARAIAACVTTDAPPGAYNIAGDGTVSLSDIARSLGARGVPVPSAAAAAASAVIRLLPVVPSDVEWLHTGRTSMEVDTTRARDVLGWQPSYTAAEALQAMADAVT